MFPTRKFIALVLFILAIPVFAEDDDRFELKFGKDLPFRGGRVTVDHGFGQLVVRTHAGNDVQVRATIRSSDDEIGKQIRIITSSEAGGVTVRTEYPEIRGSRSGRLSYSVDMNVTIPANAPVTARNRFGNTDVRGLQVASSIENKQGSIKFVDGRGAQSIGNSFGAVEVEGNRGNVTVANSNGSVAVRNVEGVLSVTNRFGSVIADVKNAATIVNSNGSIEAMDIGGPLKATNAFGSVKASTITGTADITTSNERVELSNVSSSVVVRNSFGSVVATTIRGNLTVDGQNSKVDASGITGDVKIETAFGGVTLRDVGGMASVTSSNGNIKVSDIRGALDAKTRFGFVQAERVGGTAKIDTANGSVTLNDLGAGAQVKATFGSVFVDGVKGAVAVANANGAISVAGLRGSGCQPVSLATTFSSIKLALSGDSAYDVNARTSFGRINTGLPIKTRTFGESALAGTIGAGGCKLDLVNANGNITIEKE